MFLSHCFYKIHEWSCENHKLKGRKYFYNDNSEYMHLLVPGNCKGVFTAEGNEGL